MLNFSVLCDLFSMPYHKERHGKRASLHTDVVDEELDEDATEDAKFFSTTIDALIGPEVVFDFEPQTELIAPVPWEFRPQLQPRGGNWAASFPKQCCDRSSVRWAFDNQLRDSTAPIKWQFLKMIGTNGTVRWEFAGQCPESTTVRWAFRHMMADTGKIRWQFGGQTSGIVAPNWLFENQISGRESSISWYFVQQCPKQGSVQWKFTRQVESKMQGRWTFRRQIVDDRVVPWRFVQQLVIASPVRWYFLNQMELDRHVNWTFETQSGHSHVPWHFQPCLRKEIYEAQLSWQFERCIGDSTPVAWNFLSMTSDMAPVNWENLPHMTDTLGADIPQSFEEICSENAVFKEKYTQGYQNFRRKKSSVHRPSNLTFSYNSDVFMF